MLHQVDTARFADSMAAATVGYANATTAAYAEMMSMGMDMWLAALSGFVGAEHAPTNSYPARREPAFGHSMDDWCGVMWLDPGRVDDWNWLFSAGTPAGAFAAFAGIVPLRGSCTSWPVAKTMIDAGVPRSVAWPAAEANAHAIAATEAAVAPIQRALISSNGPMGYAMQAFPLPAMAMAFWTATTFGAMRPPFMT